MKKIIDSIVENMDVIIMLAISVFFVLLIVAYIVSYLVQNVTIEDVAITIIVSVCIAASSYFHSKID